MKNSIIKTQKGIGLIEVLITTVVVAVGLLAVASLQGKFISSSGDSKIRSEALVLAQQKLEQFRNTVAMTNDNATGYDNILITGAFSDTANPIVGTNASFTRSWTITDVAPPVPPFTAGDTNLKKVSVQVGWDSNGDGDSNDADEIVNVVTEMAWIDPVKASLYAASNAGGSTSVASPRQNASEEAASEQVIGTNLAITDLNLNTTGTSGVDTQVQVTVPPDAGGVTIVLTQVAAGSHFYTATQTVLSSIEDGVIAIFLCKDSDYSVVAERNTCTHIQNHFGGVPHRIAGTVYTTSSNGFTRIKVAWTSSSVSDCYNGPQTVVSGSGNDQFRYKPYECIYAGNCDATANNVNGCTYGVEDGDIGSRDVGPGGEYGDVGLIGVEDQGGSREQVCFLEDTVDPAINPGLLTPSGNTVLNENYLYSVTKRFYSARRIKRNGSINDQKSEGINRSYTNHNFLVISRGTGNTANQLCNLKAAARNVVLAPREIFQVLDQGAPNASLADTVYTGTAGTAKTFTGIVNGNATDLKLIIPDVGSCYLNNNDGAALTAYACALPAGTVSTVIKGGSDEYPAITPNAVFASCTKTDAAPCTWVDNFTASAVSDNGCTTPWGGTVENNITVKAYQSPHEPYGPTTCQNFEESTCEAGGGFNPAININDYPYGGCTPASSPDCTAQLDGAPITIDGNGDGNGSTSPQTAYTVASVPAGFSCATMRSDLSCDNGILSGSGTFSGCSEQITRTITVNPSTSGTGTVSGITAALGSTTAGTFTSCSGTVCTVSNDWTGTLTATGTCSSGGSVSGTSATISASATTATISLGSCTGLSCALPWTGSIASGSSATAYSATSVLSPNTCTSVSESRYCNDGVLSGSYANQSCTVTPTYSIIVAAANGSGSISSSTCNGGSCSGLVAGTYTVAVTLSGGNSCSKSYTLTGANQSVVVTKATGQGTVCTMAP